jgi:hypothetical protein
MKIKSTGTRFNYVMNKQYRHGPKVTKQSNPPMHKLCGSDSIVPIFYQTLLSLSVVIYEILKIGP